MILTYCLSKKNLRLIEYHQTLYLRSLSKKNKINTQFNILLLYIYMLVIMIRFNYPTRMVIFSDYGMLKLC